MTEDKRLVLLGRDLKELSDYLKTDKELKQLHSLLTDHTYLFDINLSSRMLNYYESLGMLTFHRIGSGKRRFSFSDSISFKIAQYLKDTGAQTTEVQNIINEINKKNKAESSLLSECLAAATILIGKSDLWLAFSKDQDDFQLIITDKKQEGYFDLSNIVQAVLISNVSNLDPNNNSIKKSNFAYDLGNLIDKFRRKSKLVFLQTLNSPVSNQSWKEKINENSKSSIKNLISQQPIDKLKREFDLLYLDANDNLIGVSIKNIGSNYQGIRDHKIVSQSIEELVDAFRSEIELNQRFLEKLNK
jgi:DNA-binding transcriptional MerR regulator